MYGRRLLLPAACAVAFAVLAWVVLARHGTPYAVDTGPHDWSVAHRPHALLSVAKAVTDAGTGPFPPLAAALGGWLAAGRTARRGVLAAVAVGCTRVYLGVHWPTDVLGGWLLAACWIGVALPPLTAYADGGVGASGGDGGTGRTDRGPDHP